MVTSDEETFAHVCVDDLRERRTAAQHIRQRNDELRRTLTLVTDLLDLTKIEAGRLDVLPVDFEPDRFFQMINAMIRVRAEQKADLEFICDLPAEWPPSIRADETRLRQVLINLLDNALKFTRCGQVTLRARFQSPSRLRREIEDTGAAMSEQQLARLFRPFEQVGNAQQRALGTGLGLVISQRLARLMGSEILVASRQGKGNLFWFDLDVGIPAAAPAEPSPADIALERLASI
jgi:signal transduction histidine kinase